MFNIKNIFLNNISVRQTIVKNTFWLTFGEIAVRVCGFLLAVWIARILGAAEYGKFVFAFSFVFMMSIISDLGLLDMATREFARNPENEKDFDAVFTLQLFLAAAMFLVTAVASFFITQDPLIRTMIWVLNFSLIGGSLFAITFSFLRARQKMQYEAFVKIFQTVVNAAAVLWVILHVPSALNLSYAYLISNVLVMVAVLAVFHSKVHRLSIAWEKRFFNILKISWPLSFGFTTSWLYILINSIALGFFGMNAENGWYSAASKIALAVVLPADLILRGFYPALSKFFATDKQRFINTWNYFAGSMVILALPLMLGAAMMAGPIINFLYGAAFAPSIDAFRLLMLAVGLGCLTCPYGLLLIISDRQHENFLIIVAGLVTNVILNVVLIPMYGLSGVLWSTIIAAVVALVLTLIVLHQRQIMPLVNKKVLAFTAIATVACLAMYLVLQIPAVRQLQVLLVVGLGAAVYVGVVAILYNLVFSKPWSNRWFQ